MILHVELKNGLVHRIDFGADHEGAQAAAVAAREASRHGGPTMLGERIWIVDGRDIARCTVEER